MKLKDNIVYNQPNNQVMVKTDGNKIVIICNTEEDLDKVHKRFSKRIPCGKKIYSYYSEECFRCKK